MAGLIKTLGFIVAMAASAKIAMNHLEPIGLIDLIEPAFAKERFQPGTFRDVEYLYNHDGDTLSVNILGLDPVFGSAISVRIAHIDTAETDSKDRCEKASADLAKTKLASLLRAARKVDLVNVVRDKYFRLLADVVIEEDLDVGSYMKSEGLAVPYEGGTKTNVDWCQFPPNKNKK